MSIATPRARIAGLALAAATAVLALPAVGQAAVFTSDGNTVTVTEATAGDADDTVVSMDEPGIVGFTPGAQTPVVQGLCTYDETLGIKCPLGAGGVRISFGAGDDRVTVISLSAGAMADGCGRRRPRRRQRPSSRATPRREVVSGGVGDDELNGWGGHDALDGGDGQRHASTARRARHLLGGDGNDVLTTTTTCRADGRRHRRRTGRRPARRLHLRDGDARNAPAIRHPRRRRGRRQARRGRRRAQRRAARPGLPRARSWATTRPTRSCCPRSAPRAASGPAAATTRVLAGDADRDRIDGGAGDDELTAASATTRSPAAPARPHPRRPPERCNELHCDNGGASATTPSRRATARSTPSTAARASTRVQGGRRRRRHRPPARTSTAGRPAPSPAPGRTSARRS